MLSLSSFIPAIWYRYLLCIRFGICLTWMHTLLFTSNFSDYRCPLTERIFTNGFYYERLVSVYAIYVRILCLTQFATLEFLDRLQMWNVIAFLYTLQKLRHFIWGKALYKQTTTTLFAGLCITALLHYLGILECQYVTEQT